VLRPRQSDAEALSGASLLTNSPPPAEKEADDKEEEADERDASPRQVEVNSFIRTLTSRGTFGTAAAEAEEETPPPGRAMKTLAEPLEWTEESKEAAARE